MWSFNCQCAHSTITFHIKRAGNLSMNGSQHGVCLILHKPVTQQPAGIWPGRRGTMLPPLSPLRQHVRCALFMAWQRCASRSCASTAAHGLASSTRRRVVSSVCSVACLIYQRTKLLHMLCTVQANVKCGPAAVSRRAAGHSGGDSSNSSRPASAVIVRPRFNALMLPAYFMANKKRSGNALSVSWPFFASNKKSF